MAEVVIAEFMDEGAVDSLKVRHGVFYEPHLADRPDELIAALGDARALIVRNRTQVRGEVLAAAARLECVGRLGVGLDNIDVEACRTRGIAVHPATGANDLSVAEYAITMAMLLLRGAYGATAEVAAGAWPRQRLIGRELAGRTMGLVGFGAIAREVAWRAQALGMSLAAHDPYLDPADPVWQVVRNLSLDGLMETADVISLHVPLTDATRGMIDARRIGLMKGDAVLINAARGGLVDEAALGAALRGGRIGGAALDVFEEEPLSAAAGAKFAGIPNLVLTPHIAGVTFESNVRVSHLVAEKVLAHLERK